MKFSFIPITVELTDDDKMTITPWTISSPIAVKHVGQSKGESFRLCKPKTYEAKLTVFCVDKLLSNI